MGRVLVGELPSEMGNFNFGDTAFHENTMNLLHGPVVIDQVLQTVGHDDFMGGFIPKRPWIAIQVAYDIDGRSSRVLIDIHVPRQRFAA